MTRQQRVARLRDLERCIQENRVVRRPTPGSLGAWMQQLQRRKTPTKHEAAIEFGYQLVQQARTASSE